MKRKKEVEKFEEWKQGKQQKKEVRQGGIGQDGVEAKSWDKRKERSE